MQEERKYINLITIDNLHTKIIPYSGRYNVDMLLNINKLIKYLVLTSEDINKGIKGKQFLYDFLKINIKQQINSLSRLADEPTQSQETGLGCGRFALNNLLGERKFIITSTESADINLQEPPKQIDIRSLCTKLTTEVRRITNTTLNYFECQSSENYNEPLFRAAMGIIGYEMNDAIYINKFRMYKNIKNWKILINYGGGHWVSAKQQDNKFIFMNSVGTIRREYTDFDEFIRNHIRERNTIFVFNFIGEWIDPILPYTFNAIKTRCDYDTGDKVEFKGSTYTVIDRLFEEIYKKNYRCTHLLIGKNVILGVDKNQLIRISQTSLLHPLAYKGALTRKDNRQFGFNDNDIVLYKIDGKRYYLSSYRIPNSPERLIILYDKSIKVEIVYA